MPTVSEIGRCINGHENNDNVKYCGECGAGIASEVVAAPIAASILPDDVPTQAIPAVTKVNRVMASGETSIDQALRKTASYARSTAQGAAYLTQKIATNLGSPQQASNVAPAINGIPPTSPVIAGAETYPAKAATEHELQRKQMIDSARYSDIKYETAPNWQTNQSRRYGIIGFLIPLAGLLMWIFWRDSHADDASTAGKWALVGWVLNLIFYFFLFIALLPE